VLSENLKRIGKPYISMVRDEGHGYQQDKNKYDFYNQMESFLAKHLK
jgi:dipeptidyl aminopeptidase/acylaminoacyl peptidase